jgi:hypothetical protein
VNTLAVSSTESDAALALARAVARGTAPLLGGPPELPDGPPTPPLTLEEDAEVAALLIRANRALSADPATQDALTLAQRMQIIGRAAREGLAAARAERADAAYRAVAPEVAT